MEYAGRLQSERVLSFELERYQAAHAKAPLNARYEALVSALTFRKEMLEMNVEAGLLTMEAYLEGLRAAIKAEVARHKELKARAAGAPGPTHERAMVALKHASIMKKELDEVLAAQQEE